MLKQYKGIGLIYQLVVPNFLFSFQAKMHIHHIEKETYLNDLAKILGTGPLRLLYDKSLKYNHNKRKVFRNTNWKYKLK